MKNIAKPRANFLLNKFYSVSLWSLSPLFVHVLVDKAEFRVGWSKYLISHLGKKIVLAY